MSAARADPPASWQAVVPLADEAATEALAARLAGVLQRGDCIALSGPIGAGKTTFARALIRTLAGGPIDVPSPTFTLVQDYPDLSPRVVHYDLYRLDDAAELGELGLDEALGDAAVLIEWPERAGAEVPQEALVITLTLAEHGRDAHLSAPGDWRARLWTAGIATPESGDLTRS